METIERHMDAIGQAVGVAGHLVIQEQDVVFFSAAFTGEDVDVLNVEVFFLGILLFLQR